MQTLSLQKSMRQWSQKRQREREREKSAIHHIRVAPAGAPRAMVDPGRRILVSTPTAGGMWARCPVRSRYNGNEDRLLEVGGLDLIIIITIIYRRKKEKKEKNFALLGDGTRDLAGFLSKVRQM